MKESRGTISRLADELAAVGVESEVICDEAGLVQVGFDRHERALKRRHLLEAEEIGCDLGQTGDDLAAMVLGRLREMGIAVKHVPGLGQRLLQLR